MKPERMKLGDNGDARRRKEKWWLWGRYTPALFDALRGQERVLVNSQVSAHLQFAFAPTNMVFAHTSYILCLRYTCCLLRPPIPSTRDMGALLRIVFGRPTPLHSLRLLRDFSVSRLDSPALTGGPWTLRPAEWT